MLFKSSSCSQCCLDPAAARTAVTPGGWMLETGDIAPGQGMNKGGGSNT